MFQRRKLLATTVLTALAAAGLLLTACSGQGSPEPSGEAETVRVGYFPLAHTSTVVNAENEGLFEAEGLSVELVQTEGGATAITALTSGALDIIYTNYTSALLAASQGFPSAWSRPTTSARTTTASSSPPTPASPARPTWSARRSR